MPIDRLPLAESSRGPFWPGTLHGETLAISLSYTKNEIWVALLRGARIGVDAMTIQFFPEIESVAQNFFAPSTAAAIRQSKNPAHAFASAWTALEARIKCLKLGLEEWSSPRDLGCLSSFQHETSGSIVAVAIAQP